MSGNYSDIWATHKQSLRGEPLTEAESSRNESKGWALMVVIIKWLVLKSQLIVISRVSDHWWGAASPHGNRTHTHVHTHTHTQTHTH